jgi:hypothetical protein
LIQPVLEIPRPRSTLRVPVALEDLQKVQWGLALLLIHLIHLIQLDPVDLEHPLDHSHLEHHLIH